MKPVLFLLFAAALQSGAQPLGVPQIGAIRDASARWRTVSGIAGTLLTGPVQCGDVQAGVAVATRSLVQRANELLVLNADGTVASRQPAGQADAQLAVSENGQIALAWYSSTREWWIWRSSTGAWTHQPLLIDAEPLTWAVDETSTRVAVRRGSQLSLLVLSSQDGSILSEEVLTGASELLRIAADGSVLWIDEAGLHQRSGTGAMRQYDVPAHIVKWSPMGSHWWHAIDANDTSWALRIRDESAEWFEIPAKGNEQ